MCRIINEPQGQGGKGKKTHIYKLEQYIDLIPQNRKFLIREIYSPENIQLIEHQGKYSTYLENFMIRYLNTIQTDTAVLTNREILEKSFMVNENYFKGKKSPKDYYDKFNLNINKKDMPSENYEIATIETNSVIFFSASYRLLKRIVSDCLKSMEKRSLIIVNKTFILYKIDKINDTTTITSKHECNDDEKNRVLDAQHRTIKEFNEENLSNNKKFQISSMNDVGMLYSKDRDNFFKLLRFNILEEFQDEGYEFYANAYRINLGKKALEYETSQLNLRQLNKNVQEKLLTAKDLMIIQKELKEQFVQMFIER